MLALMTALHGQPETTLIGIEEPENYIHPAALSSFVEHMVDAQDRVQFMVTTHSPLLLDFLNDPAAVSIVSRKRLQGDNGREREGPPRRKEGVGCFRIWSRGILRDQGVRRLT